MSCHVIHERTSSTSPAITLRARPLRVALVGQPNVGKSFVFGRLTGRYVTVSNYPGTTVAILRAAPRSQRARRQCGDCRYQALCGGCRARAYAATGSFL